MANQHLVCRFCNEPFTIQRNIYRKKVKSGRKEFYCSLFCATEHNPYNEPLRIEPCMGCGEEFKSFLNRSKRYYCSQDCKPKALKVA